MSLYDNAKYIEDIHYVMSLDLPWYKLENKKILITGATGLIGSFFIDVLIEKNKVDNLNCVIYAISRDLDKAKSRFAELLDDSHLYIIPFDIQMPLIREELGKIDYVLHLASNTHPLQYSTDPVGTIITNIIGLKNMLDFSLFHKAERVIFASSNEIYGNNRGDVEFFEEDYCGYINSNTLRACYPESKRCGEALCQAYKSQYGVDVVIPRFTRTYGPTMINKDTKAISQFIKKGVSGEDIILKSEGSQLFSYQYMADSVSGLFYVLFCGKNGEAYNIAEEHSDITLKALAELIASINGSRVVFEIPDQIESAGYSTATKARLDGHKLSDLGWKPKYDIEIGIKRTISIMKESLI